MIIKYSCTALIINKKDTHRWINESTKLNTSPILVCFIPCQPLWNILNDIKVCVWIVFTWVPCLVPGYCIQFSRSGGWHSYCIYIMTDLTQSRYNLIVISHLIKYSLLTGKTSQHMSVQLLYKHVISNFGPPKILTIYMNVTFSCSCLTVDWFSFCYADSSNFVCVRVQSFSDLFVCTCWSWYFSCFIVFIE